MPEIMAFIRQAIEDKTKANSGEALRVRLSKKSIKNTKRSSANRWCFPWLIRKLVRSLNGSGRERAGVTEHEVTSTHERR